MAARRLVIALCLFLILAAIELSAPVWHDEALVFMEFAGSYVSADHVIAISALKAPLLNAHPGLFQLLHNVSRLGFQITPPLFYILLWIWRSVLGTSLIAMRLLPLLAWIAMLFVFWRWTRSPFATALLMVNSWAIEVACLARPYALAVLWIVLTAFFLDPERKSRWNPVFFGSITAALAVWTHYVAVVPIAAVIISRVLWNRRPERRRAVVALTGSAITILVVGYVAWRQLRPTTAAFTGWATEAYGITRGLLRFPVSPGLTTGNIVDIAASLLFLAVIVTTALTFRSRSGQVRLCLIVVCCQAGALLLAGGITRNQLGMGRYLGMVLPFCTLLIADWCNRFVGIAQYAKHLILATALVASIVHASRIVRLEETRKESLRDPAAFPMLFIASRSAGSGPMTVMALDIPDNSDLVALAGDEDMAAFAPDLARYHEAWICPSDEAPRPHEQTLVNRSAQAPVHLFREYSCYRIRR